MSAVMDLEVVQRGNTQQCDRHEQARSIFTLEKDNPEDSENKLELVLCAHCYNKHEEALIQGEWRISRNDSMMLLERAVTEPELAGS